MRVFILSIQENDQFRSISINAHKVYLTLWTRLSWQILIQKLLELMKSLAKRMRSIPQSNTFSRSRVLSTIHAYLSSSLSPVVFSNSLFKSLLRTTQRAESLFQTWFPSGKLSRHFLVMLEHYLFKLGFPRDYKSRNSPSKSSTSCKIRITWRSTPRFVSMSRDSRFNSTWTIA